MKSPITEETFKKIVMKLPKSYEPNLYEPEIYGLWENSSAFEPSETGESYSIVMPPPNANGNLHVGHALTLAIQDILIRYHRMKGYSTEYIPGADHAGFETWVVYDKILQEKGESRFDFTREQLYSQVWNFVQEQRGNMELQLRALGLSADWNNLTFTLDEKVIFTVYDTFEKMWREGLIYRGERIVNYSTTYQTSYSDIEVKYKEEKGTLWNIAYPTYDKIGEIIVATTRPETMFGDTAIAVHPDDERYKDLIGTRVLLPLTDREIPVIADSYVDPNYGTGAVKITPAHDPNDFEVGERHGLEKRQIIGFDGKMTNVPGEFTGLTPEEARKRTLIALKSEQLLRGEKPIVHTVGYDYKSDKPIQPLLKEQWFIHTKPLAEKAIRALENNEIKMIPTSKKRVAIQYLKELKDWNISRQIPWGIPIPAFQNVDDSTDWIFNRNVDEKTILVNGKTYRRDEDTFDTWFSSGQWPYITTDYLDGGELAKFYPLSVMETGADILYAWVTRMIMLGLYTTGKAPFKEVYLNGLVLDPHGKKMSKSKGNVVNPMETLSQYGSDALRMGIVSNRSAAQNQAFSTDKVIAARNFCNKLWNISRFIGEKIPEGYKPTAPTPESIADHWIVKELNDAIAILNNQIDNYRFAEATETIYHTIWDSVADWYIEASKNEINPSVLAWVLETSLKIAHPFAPFVTETIWQNIPWQNSLLITTSWPEPLAYNEISAAQFKRIKKLVTETRYVTAELPGNKKYDILYENDTLVHEHANLIKQLTRVNEVKKVDQPKGLRLAASGREAWLDVDKKTLYEHQTNLEIRIQEVRHQIKNLEARLDNKSYTEKAPANLVEETKKQLSEKKLLVDKLVAELNVL